MWQAQKHWLHILNKLSEAFSGETLLFLLEKLHKVKACMNKWNETALFILKSHIKPSSISIEKQPLSNDEQQSLAMLVHKLTNYIKYLSARTSGENGIACCVIKFVIYIQVLQ